jgi:prophage antirepressor-like protein
LIDFRLQLVQGHGTTPKAFQLLQIVPTFAASSEICSTDAGYPQIGGSKETMKRTLSSQTPRGIQIFKNSEFGSVRTLIDTQGTPQFCLKDVCAALELDSRQVARRLDKGVVSKHSLKTEGGRQLATFVNEDGLYDVILDSRKPSTRAFRKWVTSEVLPQIRRTGGYLPTRNPYTGERPSVSRLDRRSMTNDEGNLHSTLQLLNY